MLISQPVPITTTAGWGIGLGVTCAILAVLMAPFTCGLRLFLLLGQSMAKAVRYRSTMAECAPVFPGSA